jgi:CxxC motif-containing protein (DUF1111 family)
MKKHLYLFFSFYILLSSCKKDVVEDNIDLTEAFSGGKTTVFNDGPTAFNFPSSNLDANGLQKHLDADIAFSQTFVSAPAINFGGIGPIFNQNSCENCHVRNGKGLLPSIDGDTKSGSLMRLSLPGYSPTDGNIRVPGFGFQLQTKAIFGETPEGSISSTQFQQIIEFLDGTSATISKNNYQITNTYIPLPANAQTSFRTAPAIFGLGLIEAIAAADILKHADPDDLDKDGISGKANMVYDISSKSMKLGKFGWKAGQPSTRQQTAAAAVNDMGLTNSLFPNENCNGQSNCNSGIQEKLDLEDDLLDLLNFYVETVAVPATRNTSNKNYIAGREIFTKLKCSSCHVPSYITSSHPIAALTNQKIFPYSDFLLHDMGDGLADNRTEFDANGQEWRTPPLWGLGLVKIVNSKTSFLHDGRASTIEEAILWHGGEAEKSQKDYLKLSKQERDQLIFFLNSL